MPGNCKKKGHGPYEKEKCPQCCIHSAQVYLDNGPCCGACGRHVQWVKALELMDVEKQLKEKDENQN